MHVEMRDPPLTCDAGDGNTRLSQMLRKAVGDRRRHVHEHHVGLRWRNGELRMTRESLRQACCVVVIIGKALHVMRERMAAGSGEYPRLTHAAAKHLSHAM